MVEHGNGEFSYPIKVTNTYNEEETNVAGELASILSVSVLYIAGAGSQSM